MNGGKVKGRFIRNINGVLFDMALVDGKFLVMVPFSGGGDSRVRHVSSRDYSTQ